MSGQTSFVFLSIHCDIACSHAPPVHIILEHLAHLEFPRKSAVGVGGGWGPKWRGTGQGAKGKGHGTFLYHTVQIVIGINLLVIQYPFPEYVYEVKISFFQILQCRYL